MTALNQSVVPQEHRATSAGTTHARSTGTTRRRRPAGGPAANLVELPDPAGVTLDSPAAVDIYLSQIEVARQRQLDAMASSGLDVVAAAYRATVERILQEVRTARQRVVAGLYGTCTRCDGEISLQRLQVRPWAVTCVRCSTH